MSLGARSAADSEALLAGLADRARRSTPWSSCSTPSTARSDPAIPRRRIAPDTAGAAKAGLDPGQGARVAGLCRHPCNRARQRAAHRLRGGRLPEHRRVLEQEARHLHDHGRHLHARLRLLQRQTGLPGPLDADRAGAASPTRSRSSGSTHVVITSVDRDDLADGGAAHFAQVIRAIRAAMPGDHHRSADARLPAQGRRARGRGRRQARRLQPQSGNRAAALSDASGRARAISTPCACCSG